MGLQNFDDDNNSEILTYGCKNCKVHIAGGEHIASRVSQRRAAMPPRLMSSSLITDMPQKFRATQGRGYLFHTVRNVNRSDDAESMVMTTGENVVRWINCQKCDTYLGWVYDSVPSPDQEYKLGKFLLELELLSYI